MQPPINAGEWRRQLRQEASASARWQALQHSVAALNHNANSTVGVDSTCAAVLIALLDLMALPHGAILARRGERGRVVAAQGLALPPGASVLFDPARPSWWLPPRPYDGHDHSVPVRAPGQTVGLLCVGWQGAQAPLEEDLALLPIFAALLPAWLAEPTRAPRKRLAPPAASDRAALLSARERQVLALLPRGLTNAALATELGISAGTVKVHVERILHKLQVADRTQAAVYAVQAGLAA